jgi:hypothetical protein
LDRNSGFKHWKKRREKVFEAITSPKGYQGICKSGGLVLKESCVYI